MNQIALMSSGLSAVRQLPPAAVLQRFCIALLKLDAWEEQRLPGSGSASRRLLLTLGASPGLSAEYAVLAERLGLPNRTFVYAVGDIFRRQLVRKSGHPDDSRRKILTLSDKGLRLLTETMQRYESALGGALR